jgi:two-component system response regulator RegX3
MGMRHTHCRQEGGLRLQHNVLLFSDDVDMAALWIPLLNQANIVATIVELSDSQHSEIDEAYALLILDIYSAVAHVLELVRRIRAEAAIPILLLTPASSEAYILGAYRAGVTECVVKPVSPALFLAKVTALLHVQQNGIFDTSDVFQVGDLYLGPDCRVVTLTDGREIKLTRLECRLLSFLMRNAEQTLETNAIIEHVWGIERVWGYEEGDSTLLKNLIYRLRKKIEPDPKQPHYILWMGDGYAFFPQSQD